MTIKLNRIAAMLSLVAGLSFSLAFAATTTSSTQVSTTPTVTTTAPTTSTGAPVATETGTSSTTTPTTNTPVTAPTATETGATPTTTTAPSANPNKIYVNPTTSTNSTTSNNGAPVLNAPQSNVNGATPMGTTGSVPPAAASTMNNPTTTPGTNAATTSTQQTAVIPQANLIDFSQKAAVASFTYNYQNYQQSLQTMQSFFTKTGWASFNKALTASNNLDVVQKEKLSVSAALNGPAEITQHQQTATGQNWQVTVPIIVTYENNKKQTVQQDLNVKLIITTVSTNENANGIGIAQFIATPNVAPSATPAS